MTGCAFCGMKGFRVCDQCHRRNVVAEVVGLLLAPEPEPVELTVEDVLTFAQGLLDDREHPFNDRKIELERRTRGWTFYNDRDGSREGAPDLRGIVLLAKRRGLLG